MANIIINADDFGYSQGVNEAVKAGFLSGIVTSASLLVNFPAFNHALEILKEIPALDAGIHLNISEGRSLTKPSMLTDKSGVFNRSFIEIMLKSSSKTMQMQIEREFRAQLEKISEYRKVLHADSHMHIHAIPAVFSIVSKLTDEYGIKFIRTQQEIPYKISDAPLSRKYLINCIKNVLLSILTSENKLRNQDIRTNDNLIGILYTGGMTRSAVIEGLRKIQDEDSIVEIILHPSKFKADTARYREYQIVQDESFIKKLKKEGHILLNYRQI